MQITIDKYLKGAKEAIGMAVLIDVFRASNTIIACLVSGAEYVIPVGGLEQAYELKKKYPDHLLFGEKGGTPPPGFDSDNSPAHALTHGLRGKKVIITTSCGSQGIVNAKNADELLIASFANAQAVVNYIKHKNAQNVSLIAIGIEGQESVIEDEECACCIKDKLLGNPVDFNKIKAKLLNCDGADRLRGFGLDKDLGFCTQLDSYDIVPIYDRKNNRIIKS